MFFVFLETTLIDDEDENIDHSDTMYFGLKEYCDSMKWTHQFPLIRQDDEFERIALRTNK